MTYLIPRLYDPTSGAIRIDGRDLREVTLDSLAAAIGMVTQETYLFHDTIRTNLTYAKMDATQAEIEAAARAAQAHNFKMIDRALQFIDHWKLEDVELAFSFEDTTHIKRVPADKLSVNYSDV